MDEDFNMGSFESIQDDSLNDLFPDLNNEPEDDEEEIVEHNDDDRDKINTKKTAKSIVDKISEGDNNPEDVAEEDEDEEDLNGDHTSNLYSSLASLLSQEDLLTSSLDEKKIESKEDFINLLRDEIKNSEYADLTDTQKRYLDAVRNGVSEDTFAKYESNRSQLDNISEADIESEENQELRESLIQQSFVLKGFSEDKAAKLTQKLIESGEDIDEAKDAYNELKSYVDAEYQRELEANQQHLNQLKKAQEEQLNSIKQEVENAKEIIDGIKLSKRDKNKILDNITKVAGVTKEGNAYNKIAEIQQKDPVGFQIKLSYLLELTNGFTDFSKITTKTKARSTVERELDHFLKTASHDGMGGIGNDTDDSGLNISNINLDI
jgi:hypothetical protein